MRTIRVYVIAFLMVMGLILLALPSHGQLIVEINFVTILVDDSGNLCFIDAHPSRGVPGDAGSEPKLEVSAGMDAASLLANLTFRGILPEVMARTQGLSFCTIPNNIHRNQD